MNINNLSTAEEKLKYEDAVFVKTKGASMRPLINSKKDLAVLKKADKSPKKNSVVLFKKNGILILHRIRRISGDEYIMRGDNNAFYEYGVKNTDIIGELKAVIKNGKYKEIEKSLYLRRIYPFLNTLFFPLKFIYSKLLKLKRKDFFK